MRDTVFTARRSNNRLPVAIALLGGVLIAGAVAAAPLTIRMHPKPAVQVARYTSSHVEALASGPAISLSKAYGDEDEDCVISRVSFGSADGSTPKSQQIICR